MTVKTESIEPAIIRTWGKARVSSRQSSAPSLVKKPGRLMFLMFLLIIAGLIPSVLLPLYTKAITHPYFEVKGIDMNGVENLSEERLLAVIEPLLTGNIFTRDINKAIDLLNANPWIESASVRRSFPNAIEVSVKERKPTAAALLERLYLVDDKGYVLEKTAPLEGQLIISGFGENPKPGKKILNMRFADALGIREILSADTLFGDSAEMIDLTDPEKIAVHLSKSGAILYFGPNRFEWEQKFLEYLTVRKILSESGISFESFDLSFKNRVVVRRSDRLSTEKILYQGGITDG